MADDSHLVTAPVFPDMRPSSISVYHLLTLSSLRTDLTIFNMGECLERAKMGAMIGASVGLSIGFLFGASTALRHVSRSLSLNDRIIYFMIRILIFFLSPNAHTRNALSLSSKFVFPPFASVFAMSHFMHPNERFVLYHSINCTYMLYRYGARGREFVQVTGQAMVQSGTAFGFFLAVGSALRC